MKAGGQAGKTLKDVIDYEAGRTLLTMAQSGRVVSQREEHLALARKKFEKFLAEHPKHPLAPGARTQLANLLVERGRLKKDQAAGRNKTPGEKKKLLEESRKLYREAEKVFGQLEKEFLAAHRKFPKLISKEDTKQREAREQVRRDLLDARLKLATVTYELAATYEEGAKQRKDLLTKAAKQYYEFYDKYSSRLAGLYARMWEGRCHKELGDSKKAFDAFVELLEVENDSAPFRILQSKTLMLYLETALLPKVKDYKNAVGASMKFDKIASPQEERSPVGLAIRYLGGGAAMELARTQKNAKQAKQRKENLKIAKTYFEFVSRFPGEYQRKARAKLLDPLFGGGAAPTINTYEDARDRANELFDWVRNALPELDKKKSDKAFMKQMADSRNDAIKYYQMALRLRPPKTHIDDLSTIRRNLCWVYYLAGDLYEAAIVGEFLARRYPENVGARDGAKIAMASYQQLVSQYQKAARQKTAGNGKNGGGQKVDKGQFETARMLGIADYIARRWAGRTEANDAWMMLVHSALIDGELDKALAYIQKLPVDSKRRAEAELLAGQSLWREYAIGKVAHRKAKTAYAEVKDAYLKSSKSVPLSKAETAKLEKLRQMADRVIKDPAATDKMKALLDKKGAEMDARQKELDKKLALAKDTLAGGVTRSRKFVDQGTEVTASLATAMLSLAQICLATEKPEEAIKWLDDPKIGAVTLADANNPAALQGKVPEKIYKTALQVYVAVQELQKAEKAMNALEKLIGKSGDARAGENLVLSYIGLSKNLQRRMEKLRKEGELEQLQKTSHGFEMFLTRIAERKQGNSFQSLNWVARTFLDMGAGFDPGGMKLPPQAESYYKKAADVYRKIIALNGEKKIQVKPAIIIALKAQLAKCLRRLGHNGEAMNSLVQILASYNTMLSAQIEAAYTYQASGDAWGNKKPEFYMLAIRGGRKGIGCICADCKSKELVTVGQLSKVATTDNDLEDLKKAQAAGHELERAATINRLLAQPTSPRCMRCGGPLRMQDAARWSSIVWGWGKISKKVHRKAGRDPKYKAVFHEARYNLALCRFKLAQASKSTSEKQSTLERAERDVLVVQKILPEMGGQKWYDKYDDLLKKIQGLLGKPALGLKTIETKTAKQ